MSGAVVASPTIIRAAMMQSQLAGMLCRFELPVDSDIGGVVPSSTPKSITGLMREAVGKDCPKCIFEGVKSRVRATPCRRWPRQGQTHVPDICLEAQLRPVSHL